MSVQVYPSFPVHPVAYGSWSDNTSQLLATGVVTYVRFNTVELQQFMSIQNDGGGFPTKIVVEREGTYSFSISPQLIQGSGGATDVDFWAVVDNVAVPRSASRISLPNNMESLPYLELILSMKAGSAFQWAFYTAGTGVSLFALAASPPVPAVPSVIVGAKQIQ